MSSKPVTMIRPDGTEREWVLAKLGARAYAFFYDLMACLLLALLWSLFLNLFFQEATGLSSWLAWLQNQSPMPSSATGIFLILGFYHPILEGVFSGKTLGKKIAGIEVVNRQGKAPSWSAVFLRQIGRAIDFLPGFYAIGILSCLLSDEGLRFGDRLANTLVIYDDAESAIEQHFSAENVRLNEEKEQYLRELLNRWENMALERRCKLGAEFLSDLHLSAPQGVVDNRYDRSLKLRLSTLLSKAMTKAK